MRKKIPIKTIYYENELEDDFANGKINPKPLKSNYKHIHKNPIWKMIEFVVYYLVAVPIVFIYTKLILNIKFHNKKPIKKLKSPCFLYGNHIGHVDAFIPNILSLFRRNQILVSPAAVSIKGLKTIVEMFGGMPIGDTVGGLKRLTDAIDYYYSKGRNITIYPEAHIWPYYTGVRNFKRTSFAYPVRNNAPVIAFFTAFSKPKGLFSFLRKANIDVYVSDPFYVDKNLSNKEAQEKLGQQVYDFMKHCSEKYSTYSYIEYKHISEKTDK